MVVTAAATLPFGEPTGLVVYLTPTGGAPDSIRAYDVDTGIVHDVSFGGDIGWYIRAIDGAGGAVVDGERAVLLADGEARTIMRGGDGGWEEAPNGRTAPGPDGGLWARGFDPSRLELFDSIGNSTGIVHELAIGSELYGSMADGRPVMRREDRRLAVIEPDGSPTPLADNALSPVEAGRFAEVRCEADQECHVFGHIDDTTIDFGLTRDADGAARRFRFQPDGPLVAVSVNGQISLIDTSTGNTAADIARASDQAWFGNDDQMPVRFLPGGRGLIIPTGYGLDLVDLTGTKITEVSLDMTAGIVNILGVGFAHPWEF